MSPICMNLVSHHPVPNRPGSFDKMLETAGIEQHESNFADIGSLGKRIGSAAHGNL